MHFEHIIMINDPADVLLEPISTEQVWQGLVLRAQAPQLFQDGIERVSVEEKHDRLIHRELVLGTLLVRDRIHLEPLRSVRYETEASEHHGGGTLTVSLETPNDDTLLLRFTYDTPHDESAAGGDDAKYLGYLRNAYRANDVDIVRRIRELAALGKLE